MLSLTVVNKLGKKVRHLSRKRGLRFLQNVSAFLEQKKQALIFRALAMPEGPEERLAPAGIHERIIWICWFQGAENAPPLVKRCIESVQQQANGAKVVLLTDENIADFIELPAHIRQKYTQGRISKAHYSDIVRCALLYQYGGIWMDATLFVTRPLPDHFFTLPFSSLRFEPDADARPIGKGYWTAYMLAATQHNATVKFVRDSFYHYWLHHDSLIEYFLIDYAFLYAWTQHAAFRRETEAQPVTGNQRYLIRRFINQPLGEEAVRALRQDETGIYKLSHKERYQVAVDGRATIYQNIIDGKFSL